MINDAWEKDTTRGGHGDTTKDARYYFETDKYNEVLVFAWGDLRADIAVKAATEEDLAFDRRDWSDLPVGAGVPWEYVDEDDTAGTHRQLCSPTTSGNNKDAR